MKYSNKRTVVQGPNSDSCRDILLKRKRAERTNKCTTGRPWSNMILWHLRSWGHNKELLQIWKLRPYKNSFSSCICHIGKLLNTNKYRKPSVTRTPMARLPWLIRTRFWVHRKFLWQLKKTNSWGNFGDFSYYVHFQLKRYLVYLVYFISVEPQWLTHWWLVYHG